MNIPTVSYKIEKSRYGGIELHVFHNNLPICLNYNYADYDYEADGATAALELLKGLEEAGVIKLKQL